MIFPFYRWGDGGSQGRCLAHTGKANKRQIQPGSDQLQSQCSRQGTRKSWCKEGALLGGVTCRDKVLEKVRDTQLHSPAKGHSSQATPSHVHLPLSLIQQGPPPPVVPETAPFPLLWEYMLPDPPGPVLSAVI